MVETCRGGATSERRLRWSSAWMAWVAWLRVGIVRVGIGVEAALSCVACVRPSMSFGEEFMILEGILRKFYAEAKDGGDGLSI